MGLNGGQVKGFGGGLSGIGGQVSGFGGARFAVLGSGHWVGYRGPGWRVGIGALDNMVRMGEGLEQGGSVAGREVSELEFFGELGIMGGDGASICHKRQVIHKKLCVLAPTGMTELPEWGGVGAGSDRLGKAGTRERLPSC